jgi:HTH-type transcriptional regulator, sugar sensing transcriptional regulator
MKENITILLEIGLTEYEAKAYSAMLLQDLVTASDLAKISGIPRGRIYDVINQLIEKGFCSTVPGSVKKFKAVDPESAIKCLIEQQKKKETIMLDAAKLLKEKFINKKESTTSLDYINILTSKQSQIKKFHELEDSAKEFMLAFVKKPYAVSTVSMEDLIKFSEPQKELIKRGVKSKSIYEAEYDDYFIKWIKYFESIGEEIRICESLPIKMLITDNNIVMISLRNEGVEKFNILSMVVEHSDLTVALVNLFNFYWNASKTIEEFIQHQEKLNEVLIPI